MMTWTEVVFSLVLLVASSESLSPLARQGLADFSSVSSRVDGDYRLPNDTVPISYVIRLIPYIEEGNFTFDGQVGINLQVVTATTTITLHAHSSVIIDESRTTLVSEAGTSQTVTAHNYVTDEEFVVISVQNALAIGNYTLTLYYIGTLHEENAGFYRSSYVNDDNETVWLATTQFESTDARRAFPCYDEPALKATFDIGIKHERWLHALSNMPISSQVNDTTDDKTWTYFGVTPIMSTYLVAFVVSDFDSLKSAEDTFNVWSRPNAIGLAQYALDVGTKELEAIVDYVGVTYDLPKMDQIAIPDFAGGAMENWGLVTYRESMFHYNESTSTLATKQTVASTVAHEFGHQWFGNLVSPAWWKYLWLNEGFATYLEWKATDLAEDNWRMMDQFVIKDQQATAFVLDSSASSHAMNQDAATPNEISGLFDQIAYAKAGCIIRMMSHILTEDVFRDGLSRYLTANAYSSATSDDLFEALHDAENRTVLPSHVYVKEVMDTWVNQMGYPVVTVTKNYTTGTTVLHQERFLLGDADETDTHDYKWWVPLSWTGESQQNFDLTVSRDWIRAQDESVITTNITVGEWTIVNLQQTGFYRVNYDLTNWKLLSDYLDTENYGNIHVLNRAALIDDSLNLARTSRLNYSVVLDLSVYLAREVDYVPWYAAFTGISYLNRVLANTDDYESFKTYFAYLTTAVWDAVGIDEADTDDHATKLNRVNVINYACAYGLESCRSSAQEKLASWLDDSTANPLSPSLRTNTICAALRSADSTLWNRALAKYFTATESVEQTALLAGLGCSENEEIITNWLSTIIDPTTGLSTSTASSALIYVYQGNSYNVDRAFDFIVSNLDDIISYFGGSTAVRTFIVGIAYRMTTAAQLEKLTAFIDAQSDVINNSTSVEALGYVASNMAWNTNYEEDFSSWIISKLAEIEAANNVETTTEDNSAATSFLSLITAFSAFIAISTTK